MNRSKLKTYAPQARRAFIQAVTDRAALFGLTAKKVESITEEGDVAIIHGKAFPRSVAEKRRRLEERIERQGFDQAAEAIAYTWFNRLVAIRYMEIHGYLDHGYRVLSHPEGKDTPEILQHAEHVTLPGLDSKAVIDLKLDGTKESELYRMLLIAQCNALHAAMPFLFERIDDETELLLPDNLLHSDSIVRTLVASVAEDDWQEVEIVGWLYQFYISEKKDQVIGKVVKSEDIPAATQLFTPNWIVKYLVQNSLGRQWVATYPNSSLKAKMEYYIEPAEQTPEVQAQLDAITPKSLSPEELTLMDPACGSGHILVEAYDLLKEIYLERGYRLRDIPSLILSKNLFGLEIDDRAAQLAAFALMMKARADDRRIFDGKHQPNVISIQESNGLDINGIVQAFTSKRVTNESFAPSGEFAFMAPIKAPLFAHAQKAVTVGDDRIAADLTFILHLFEDAKTYGSLVRIPEDIAERLPALTTAIENAMAHSDWIIQEAGRVANVFVTQASLLAGRHDAVAANPPYLNSNAMQAVLKNYMANAYPDAKTDLFSAFIQRNCQFAKNSGFVGLMTPFVWMFLKSYEKLRRLLVGAKTISSLVHPEYHAFFDSAFVPICAFVLRNCATDETGEYFDLSSFYGADIQPTKLKEAISSSSCGWRYSLSSREFSKIPGSPIAYWANARIREVFASSKPLSCIAMPKQGLATGDNDRFLRFWSEVGFETIGFRCGDRGEAQSSGKRWFPCNKGGPFRKWYGNNDYVVDWYDDGVEMRNFRTDNGRLRSRPQNMDYYFREGITWSTISSSHASFRYSPVGCISETKGAMCFVQDGYDLPYITAFLNSQVVNYVLRMFSPTLDFHEGPVGRLPVVEVPERAMLTVSRNATAAIELAMADWNDCELSWEFQRPPLVTTAKVDETLTKSYEHLIARADERIHKMVALEEENNRVFIDAYGLCNQLSHEVPEDQITLYRPEQEEDIKRLISYAVGCMMGRYSLDEPGLVYACSGNEGFDPSSYSTFPADADGIVPVTEIDWFEDGAGRRFEEFMAVAWPTEHLEENLAFVAESLGAKKKEQPWDAIRRYFAKGFFKDHLKTYRKRPIYWLFSSGKFGAFQCLVYLHRYNEGTLARMRTEYVIPLQGKIAARIEQLEGDKDKATSASHRNKIQKEQDTLRKHQEELRAFDEKLRHYADQRIKLDLDDGVKVNYGKFGDLLAEVKAVCGKKKDED